MEFTSFSKVRQWEDVLLELLQGYTLDFYGRLKSAYEAQFLALRPVQSDEDSFVKLYHFDINNDDAGRIYEKRLKELATLIAKGDMPAVRGWSANHMVAICFERHLYWPLMWNEDKTLPLKMTPVVFDSPSEVRFVRDLEEFYATEKGKSLFANRDLYLLRNAAHPSKGIGFTLAGNFYPDFLLWVVEGEKQYLTFIDPKGLRQVDLNSPKMQLFQTIKEHEAKIGDAGLVLNAFVLSETRFVELLNNRASKADLADRHVLFMEDGKEVYLGELFRRILDGTPTMVAR